MGIRQQLRNVVAQTSISPARNIIYQIERDLDNSWRKDPDPYGYHGIDIERRLDEMELLPKDLL